MDAASDSSSRDVALRPEVGSPACEDEPCVLCSDGDYHCHASVYPPCPAGVSQNTNCVGSGVGSVGCFVCDSDGKGDVWRCTASDGNWTLVPYDCTP
jgi:hypothetical protein